MWQTHTLRFDVPSRHLSEVAMESSEHLHSGGDFGWTGKFVDQRDLKLYILKTYLPSKT